MYLEITCLKKIEVSVSLCCKKDENDISVKKSFFFSSYHSTREAQHMDIGAGMNRVCACNLGHLRSLARLREHTDGHIPRNRAGFVAFFSL